MDDDATTDGRAGGTGSDDHEERAGTRRAFLAATAGSGLLAAAPGTALGRTRTPHRETVEPVTETPAGTKTPTDTESGTATETPEGGSGPPAPTNPSAGHAPASSQQFAVFWDGPADPCGADLSHYVVSVDGTRQKTVPAGQTAAYVPIPGSAGERVSWSVRAVDGDGNESAAATGEHRTLIADYGQLLRVRPESETVETGGTVRASVELVPGPVGSALEELSAFEVTVSTATPCVASIAGASCAETVGESQEPTVADDGSSVTLAGSDASAGEDPTPFELGTVVLEANAGGGTVLDVAVESLSVPGGGSIVPAEVWSPVTVVGGTETVGPTPTDVTTSRGAGTTTYLSWTGVPDPCTSVVEEYVVSVDGEDVATVPAGVTAARIDPGGGEHVVVVRAVGESGEEWPSVERTITVPSNDPKTILSVDLADDAIATGETTTAEVSVEPGYVAAEGTVGGEVVVELSAPCAVSISGINLVDDESDSDTAYVQGGTLRMLPDGSFSGTFAEVELTGEAPGASLVDVRAPYDDGVAERFDTLTVAAESAETPEPVGGNESPPRDPDDDGLYEDVNGNGRQDIADAVDLFQHQEAVDPQFFDFNDSGEMEIGDAVELFRENTG